MGKKRGPRTNCPQNNFHIVFRTIVAKTILKLSPGQIVPRTILKLFPRQLSQGHPGKFQKLSSARISLPAPGHLCHRINLHSTVFRGVCVKCRCFFFHFLKLFKREDAFFELLAVKRRVSSRRRPQSKSCSV